jgi:hypothetical protein
MTLEEVKNVIEKAQKKGAEAAAAKYAQMCRNERRRGGLRGLCGGAHIMIKLDGRTRLARQLRLVSQQIDYLSFNATYENGTKAVHIAGMHNRQEREIDAAASKAALAVVKIEFHVVGYVEAYYT